MDDAKKVSEAIANGKGFKAYFKGGFGKRAKEAQELWGRASEQVIAPAVLVRDMSGSDGVAQRIYAFATNGKEVPAAAMTKLQAKAESLTPADIKTDDRGYIGLAPLRPAVGSPLNKKGHLTFKVADLAKDIAGVKTFLSSELYFDANDAAASQITVVLYAKIDNEDHLAPLKTGTI